MDATVERADDPEISAATKATLAVLGVSFACAALLAAWRILQALVIRPFLSAKPKQQKPAKPVAAHLQSRAAQKAALQAQSGNTSGGEAPGRSIKQLLKKKKAGSHGSQAADAGSHSPLYLNTLKGHGDLVTGLAWSSDGQALATACEESTIRVFNLSGDLTSSNINFRRKDVKRGLVDVAFGQAKQLVVLTKGMVDAASLAMYDCSSNFATLWEVRMDLSAVNLPVLLLRRRCGWRLQSAGSRLRRSGGRRCPLAGTPTLARRALADFLGSLGWLPCRSSTGTFEM